MLRWLFLSIALHGMIGCLIHDVQERATLREMQIQNYYAEREYLKF